MSPSITSTLTFILCTTIFPITRPIRNEKYKRERSKITILRRRNCPKNYTQELSSLSSGNTRVFIGQWGIRGVVRSRVSKLDVRLHSMIAETPPRSRFSGHAAAVHAAPGRESSTGGMDYVLTSDFLLFAPKISRLGFKLLGFF